MGNLMKYGVRIHKPEEACEGYTLIAPFTTRTAWLIDMKGNFVHRWVMPTSPRNHGVLLENGKLLYATWAPLLPESDMSHARTGAWGIGAGLIEVDWDGKQVWKYVDKYQHHDFYRMKNGNTMINRLTRIPPEIAYKLRGGIPGSEDRGMMWCEGLHEVTPDGKVVWEWSFAEHLDPERHILCPVEHRADFTHCNSVEVLPDGNVLTSYRNISTILIVDKKTKKIKWQWGPGEISHQHDPTLLPNGNIMVFDNGAHRQDGSLITYSRVVEVNPSTNKIEWEYKADPPQSFYSSLISGNQRLPNGNTLICEGMKGRVFEVTRDGEIVWEFVNPFFGPHAFAPKLSGPQTSIIRWGHLNAVFRAKRYTPNYPGLKGKDLNPQKLEWVNRVYGPQAI